MTIRFKGKIRRVYYTDDTLAYEYINVPKLARNHVNMQEARQHPKYGAYANSDLFPGMLNRIRSERLGDRIKMNAIPEGVTVDTSGFLAEVSLSV